LEEVTWGEASQQEAKGRREGEELMMSELHSGIWG
jgi:hypothetical protein